MIILLFNKYLRVQERNLMKGRKNILIVEDNLINRLLLREILIKDYKVLEADNGQSAIDLLNNTKEEISLILLDIVMPVMNGYEFLHYIRNNDNFSSIPVIVTTQGDSEKDEINALSNGATDFVVKPYKPQIILHRVANMIKFRENAALLNLLQYDPLTQLYSKAYFFQKSQEIIMRNPEKQYEILCFDVENFKIINDIFGTEAGNNLLKKIADVYYEFVENKGICCRFHADQFACLINEEIDYSDLLFSDLLLKINENYETKKVMVRCGIYSIDNANLPIEQMCDRAFMAANSIKGQYGKYFARYDENLRNKMLREQEIKDSMEIALENKLFEVYLQPKYRLKDEMLIGAEALVRWNHPIWGLQMPESFIPLFEKNGFITKLDQYIFECTCELLQKWKEKGYPEISLSVNVSRADAYNSDLTNFLLYCLNKYRLKPQMLHLEITESAYTEDPDQLIEMVKNFRELGFIIEMDDFGSGYSSLNMLNELPIDILKLDMKFIRSEMSKPDNKSILGFVIKLAKWMNLEVIAEGIETEKELERLKEMNCDYGQGFYFAKPLPIEVFESLLAETLKTKRE